VADMAQTTDAADTSHSPPTAATPIAATLPDPMDNDLSGWLLRRLDLAAGIAEQLRNDADEVTQLLKREDQRQHDKA
jgi:hypothetical protein